MMDITIYNTSLLSSSQEPLNWTDTLILTQRNDSNRYLGFIRGSTDRHVAFHDLINHQHRQHNCINCIYY